MRWKCSECLKLLSVQPNNSPQLKAPGHISLFESRSHDYKVTGHAEPFDILYGSLARKSQNYRQIVMLSYHSCLFEILHNHMEKAQKMLSLGTFQKTEMTPSLVVRWNVKPELKKMLPCSSWWKMETLLMLILQVILGFPQWTCNFTGILHCKRISIDDSLYVGWGR